jgi:ferritin-like metal-binding protein YciE
MNRDHLTRWLKDAYGMEQAAIGSLTRQADNLDDYPEVRQRLLQHLEDTRWQAEELKRCLGKLDVKPSALKNLTGKAAAVMDNLAVAFTRDDVVKNGLAGAAFEHFEIAAYRSLIAAARACAEPEIAEACERILRQEEEMADWAEAKIGPLTIEFLSRDEASH